MADDEALIAKAAHVLLPYLSYTDDDFPDEAARAVVAVVRDQIAAGALREAVREESINFTITSMQLLARAEALCGDESTGNPPQTPEMAPESDAGAETAVLDVRDAAGNSEGENA